jgi:Na+-translocating ferredoxin:NAD+ oxidoreductase RNF subunit RnfB
MVDYGIIIAAVGALGVLGVVFAVGLAFANAKFAVKIDPRAEQILAALPGANCGACGYAGCAAYAEAVAAGKVGPTSCIPGGGKAAEAVAHIMGLDAAPVDRKVAVVRCNRTNCRPKVDYQGIADCKAAALLTDNVFECSYACMGLGTCARACPFGAITMSPTGLPRVNESRCTGCAVCVAVCPKKVLSVDGVDSRVHVLCSSRDKGAVARKLCERACIACGRCVKECPSGAIKIEDFLACFDYSKCVSCGKCMIVCPTGAIGDFSQVRRSKADAA